MTTMEYTETLLSITPARPGWYAFFEDKDDPHCPLFAEPIEAWGIHDTIYSEGGEPNRREVHAMVVESEIGSLDNDFVNMENFLGIFFSQSLLSIAETDFITYQEICQVPQILKRLENIIYERDAAVQNLLKEHEGLPIETKTIN